MARTRTRRRRRTGKRSEYTLISYDGQVAVGDRVVGRDGLDVLKNVENITFLGDNQTLTLAQCGIATALQYINAGPISSMPTAATKPTDSSTTCSMVTPNGG